MFHGGYEDKIVGRWSVGPRTKGKFEWLHPNPYQLNLVFGANSGRRILDHNHGIALFSAAWLYNLTNIINVDSNLGQLDLGAGTGVVYKWCYPQAYQWWLLLTGNHQWWWATKHRPAGCQNWGHTSLPMWQPELRGYLLGTCSMSIFSQLREENLTPHSLEWLSFWEVSQKPPLYHARVT